MHLNLLLTVAAATSASLPAANAMLDPDEEGAAPPPTEGEATVTTLMMPVDGDKPPSNDEVSITTTIGQQSEEMVHTVPGLYQDSDLVGPTWAATKYYDATKGELVEVAEGSTITLEFEEDGTFDGHSGCNNYFGGYESSPEEVASVERSTSNSNHLAASSFTVVGPLGGTLMLCNKDLMDQERAYLANLNGAINYSVLQDGSTLELKDAKDKVVAEYSLFAPLLLDQTWTATQYYNHSSEELVEVISGSTITLRMETGERLDGNAGCNRYISSYDDLTSASFAIAGEIGSTKMFCDVPDRVMEQEEMYLKIFEDGREMKWSVLDDGSLELRDAGEDIVVALYTATADLAATAELKGASDPLSTSGAMAIGTSVAAFAIMTVMLAW